MASNNSSLVVLFLTLNLLASSLLVSALLNPNGGASYGTCPKNALNLGVCANLLGLLKLNIGHRPSDSGCCPLIAGLTDLEAAICLCTAIRANVMGVCLDVPLSLELLLNYCGYGVPKGFRCPN